MAAKRNWKRCLILDSTTMPRLTALKMNPDLSHPFSQRFRLRSASAFISFQPGGTRDAANESLTAAPDGF
jgi:hypothetical protein